MTRTILITGAAGSIGRKLRAHFGPPGHRLVLLDRPGAGDPDVEAADLAVWEDRWAARFRGVDCVIHLAGDPRSDAAWPSVVRNNLDLVMNVFEATVRGGAKRLVFASSNWTMAGHRFTDGDPLPTDRDAAPINPYGASKLFGERIGRSYSERDGLSVVCFRIGYCQHAPGNRPGPHMGWGRWGQSMWLSDDDLCGAMQAAVEAPDTVRFAVLNLMSANPGMRWDMAETERVLGWRPKDGAVPQVDAAAAAREATAASLTDAADRIRALMAAERL